MVLTGDVRNYSAGSKTNSPLPVIRGVSTHGARLSLRSKGVRGRASVQKVGERLLNILHPQEPAKRKTKSSSNNIVKSLL